MIALLAGQAGEGGSDSPWDAYKETLSATTGATAFPKKTSPEKGVMEGPCWWQVNSNALRMGMKGSGIFAHRDFDGIYPTAPVFVPKMRRSSREVWGEQGLCRGRLLPGKGECCWGGGRPPGRRHAAS